MPVDRRSLMMAGAALALVAQPGRSQAEDKSAPAAGDDTAPVKAAAELWSLLTAMNALIYLLADGVLKDDKVVYQSLGEFQPYSSQLSAANSIDAFNNALKSDDGLQRAKDAAGAIAQAGDEVGKLLASVVSDSMRDNLVAAFRRVSTLLACRSDANRQWWCHVYAFRKIAC